MSGHDPTLKNKLSPHIDSQLPDFVRQDHPLFIQFVKYYYEFLEAGELTLSGTNDYVIEETITPNRILLEDEEHIVLEESVGKFAAGETILGSTSRATAKVLVDDFDDAGRLFITSQQRFITGETIVGQTSGAVSTVISYRANPVQNIQQFLAYGDVDNTIYDFLDKFRDSFMEAIPNTLADGLEKRKLIKNIKDLYSAKGTEDGHKLFFRMLFNEESEIIYPRDNLLRSSDGEWSSDKVIRVTENGTSDFSNAIGQKITGSTSGATAIVTTVIKFREGSVLIAELNLDPDSVVGTFQPEEIVKTTDTTLDLEISATVKGIVTGATLLERGAYYTIGDSVTIGSGGNNAATARIESIVAGSIDEILIEDGGSGYSVGDEITYNNTDTEGVSARARVAVVGGAFVLEQDTSPDHFITEDGDSIIINHVDNIELEDATFTTTYLVDETDEDNLILEDGGLIVAEKTAQEYARAAGDHTELSGDIISEDSSPLVLEQSGIFYSRQEETVGELDYLTLESGEQIVLEEETFNDLGVSSEIGEITKIDIINAGNGYLKTPLLSVSSTTGSGADLYACSLVEPKVGSVGGISITNFGLNYTTEPDVIFNRNFLVKNVSGSFTAGDTLTSHTGTIVDFDANRNIVKISTSITLNQDDVITTVTGASATVQSSDFATGNSSVGVVGTTVGNFVNDKGKVSVDTMKVQDSFYYQDYSYVVRIGESINQWRESIRRSVHPAGWNVFGEVSFASEVAANIQIPAAGQVVDYDGDLTFSPELASTFRNIFTTIFTRRLGTTTDKTTKTENVEDIIAASYDETGSDTFDETTQTFDVESTETALVEGPMHGYASVSDIPTGKREVTLTSTITTKIGVANVTAKYSGPTLENVAQFGFSVHPVFTEETFPNSYDPSGRRITTANNQSRDQYSLAQIGYIGIRDLCLADGSIPDSAYTTRINFMPPSEIYLFRSGLTNLFDQDFIKFDDGITRFDEFDAAAGNDTEGRYATSFDEVGTFFFDSTATTLDTASGNEEDFTPRFDGDTGTSLTFDADFTFDNALPGTTSYALFSNLNNTFDSDSLRTDETETQTTRYGFSLLDFTSDSNLIKFDQTTS